jgi:hypothetical protein
MAYNYGVVAGAGGENASRIFMRVERRRNAGDENRCVPFPGGRQRLVGYDNEEPRETIGTTELSKPRTIFSTSRN